jgi:hypothetical protein
LLVSWCTGSRCDMEGSDEYRDKSRRPGADDQRWLSIGRVTPCTVCTVYMETMSTGFLVEPQNQGQTVSQFGPQNRQLRFDDLDLKITATVSWFGPQNQTGYGLLVAPQNQQRKVGVEHASRSDYLLHMKACHARVFQSGLKTGGGATMGGTHGIITGVTSSGS